MYLSSFQKLLAFIFTGSCCCQWTGACTRRCDLGGGGGGGGRGCNLSPPWCGLYLFPEFRGTCAWCLWGWWGGWIVWRPRGKCLSENLFVTWWPKLSCNTINIYKWLVMVRHRQLMFVTLRHCFYEKLHHHSGEKFKSFGGGLKWWNKAKTGGALLHQFNFPADEWVFPLFQQILF